MERTKDPLKSYFLKFFTIVVITSMVVFLLQTYMPYAIHRYIWIIQAFFITVSATSHLVAHHGLKKNTEFHLFYMASMAIRFLLALIFLFFAMYKIKIDHFTFIIDFFILYLVYTSFEIYYLLRNLRPDFDTNEEGYNNS